MKLKVPTDTAVRSIWVDKNWFLKMGGTIVINHYESEGADGQKMNVCGAGKLSVLLWGYQFYEKSALWKRSRQKYYWDIISGRNIIHVGIWDCVVDTLQCWEKHTMDTLKL